MSEKDKQAIVKALEAIASALSFCETDMELVLWDRLDAIHGAIDELRAVRGMDEKSIVEIHGKLGMKDES